MYYVCHFYDKQLYKITAGMATTEEAVAALAIYSRNSPGTTMFIVYEN